MMPITPEQARAELARRELERRRQSMPSTTVPGITPIADPTDISLPQVQAKQRVLRERNQKEAQGTIEPAPKRGLLRRVAGALREDPAKAIAGVAANTIGKPLLYVFEPAWAKFKKDRPQDVDPAVKNMTLEQAVNFYGGRDPSMAEKLVAGIASFALPAGEIGKGLASVAPMAKSAGIAGNAARTAVTWGAAAATHEVAKGTAQAIDPDTEYGYRGAIAPVETAAAGAAVGAVGATSLPVATKKLTESAIFAGQAAASGGSPTDVLTAAAIPLVMSRQDIASDNAQRRIRKRLSKQTEASKALDEEMPVSKPRVRVTGEVGAETKPTGRVMGDLGAETQPTKVVNAGTTSSETSIVPSDISEPAGASKQFSVRNEATAQLRERVGLPQRVVPDSESVGLWRQQAADKGIPERANEIADEVISTGRPITHVEEQGLQIRIEQVKDQYDQLEASKAKADDAEVKDILKAQGTRRDELLKLIDASEQGGRALSYGMTSRKGLKDELNDDTSPAAMTTKAEIAKGTRLTPEETAKVTENTAKVKKAREGEQEITRQANRKSAAAILKGAKNRSRRRGSRYGKMTEADKDAELTKLLDLYQNENDARALAQVAKNLISRDGINDIGDVMTRLQDTLPDIDQFKIADALVESARRQAQTADETAMMLSGLAREARTQDKLRTAIEDYLWHYREGTYPEANRRLRKPDTEMNEALRSVRDQVKQMVEESEAGQLAKMQRQLDWINARLANGDFEPPKKTERPLRSEALEKKAYEITLAREELQKQIANLKPKSAWRKWTGWTRVIQSIKSSIDVSAVRRQGGLYVAGHPIRSLKRLPDMFKALTNKEESYRLNSWLTNPDNPRAWLYKRAGLEFTDPSGLGGLTSMEEEFQSDWANRIPGVGASNRAFSTFLNLIRADSFDALSAAYTKPGSIDLQTAKSLAAFVNVMTGRGDISKFKDHAATLNGLLWSPRFTISRFEYALGVPLWRAKTWTARKIIAQEYARQLAGTAVILALYQQVFGGTIERDPRSADFLKLKIGNTRLDPLAGLSQVTVFMAREISGKSKTASGQINPIRGEVPFGRDTMLSVAGRFARFKLGWAPGAAISVATRSDAVGHPTGLIRELIYKGPVPLSFDGILGLMQDQGIPKGLALETLQMFGEGVQTYEPKPSSKGRGGPGSYASRRLIRRR